MSGFAEGIRADKGPGKCSRGRLQCRENRTHPLENPPSEGPGRGAHSAPYLPGWPDIFTAPLCQVARILVHPQYDVLNTYLQETQTGPRSLRDHKKTLATRFRTFPSPLTSISHITASPHTPLRSRHHGPYQRNNLQDGRRLAPGPMMGLKLLHVNSNTYTSGRGLHP